MGTTELTVKEIIGFPVELLGLPRYEDGESAGVTDCRVWCVTSDDEIVYLALSAKVVVWGLGLTGRGERIRCAWIGRFVSESNRHRGAGKFELHELTDAADVEITDSIRSAVLMAHHKILDS